MKIADYSNSPYGSPLLPIKNKDGCLRLCSDYHKLSVVTLTQQKPTPSPECMFPKLAKAQFFMKFELSRGYWQIHMADNSKRFTAFSSPLDKLQFLVLRFGLSWSPSTFTKLIKQLRQDLSDVISYLDMLAFHQTMSEHLVAVHRLLNRVREFGLTGRPTKTYVATNEVVIWGYAIRQGRFMLELLLLSKIMSIKVHTTKNTG